MKKSLIAFLLTCFALLPLDLKAENDQSKDILKLVTKVTTRAGWERRRKKELMDKGIKISKIPAIIKKEKEETAKKNNKSLKTKLDTYLKAQGLEDNVVDNHKESLYQFLLRICDQEEDDQLKAIKAFNERQALEAAKKHKLLSKTHKEDLETIAKQWETWFYQRNSIQNKQLKKLSTDLATQREAAAAKAKAAVEKKRLQEIKIATLKETIAKELKAKGLTGLDYDMIFRKELKFRTPLINDAETEREQKLVQLRIEDTQKFIVRHKILDEGMTGEITLLSNAWEKSYYNGISKRVAAIKKQWNAHKASSLNIVKGTYRSKLSNNGVTGSELDNLLEIEMVIQDKLLDTIKSKRAALSKKLHKEKAAEIIANHKLKIDKIFHEKLALDYEKWLYFSMAEQKIKLKQLAKIIEKDFMKAKKEEIEATLTKEKGLKGDDLVKVAKIVLKVELELSSVEEAFKEKTRLKLMKLYSQDLAISTGLFRDCPKDFPEKASETWQKWFYLKSDLRFSALSAQRDKFEKERTAIRLKKHSASMKKSTEAKLNKYWNKKITTASGRSKLIWKEKKKKAMKWYGRSWDQVSKISKRKYIDKKSSIRKQLTKTSYTSDATKILTTAFDDYFDAK